MYILYADARETTLCNNAVSAFFSCNKKVLAKPETLSARYSTLGYRQCQKLWTSCSWCSLCLPEEAMIPDTGCTQALQLHIYPVLMSSHCFWEIFHDFDVSITKSKCYRAVLFYFIFLSVQSIFIRYVLLRLKKNCTCSELSMTGYCTLYVKRSISILFSCRISYFL